MKATCPKNPEHKQFVTTAHVVQEWAVTETGDFVEVVTECLEVAHKPDARNIWSCRLCGADAKVE